MPAGAGQGVPTPPTKATPELRVATFNVRGLAARSKQEQLCRDMVRYKVDVAGLQETRCKDFQREYRGQGGGRVINLGKGPHGGVGFYVAKRLWQRVESWTAITERVAVLDFAMQGHKRERRFRLVAACAPTSQRAKANPEELEAFYDGLRQAWDTSRTVWAAGDFSSKVGGEQDRRDEDGKAVGRHGRGKRNRNGQRLVEWCLGGAAMLSNTCFEHSHRHRTTWTGWVQDRKQEGGSRPVYNQIDFVAVQAQHAAMVMGSRAYGGTEVNSDHKMVVCRLRMGNLRYGFRQPRKEERPLALERLQDPRVKEAYSQRAAAEMQKASSSDGPQRAGERMAAAMEALKTAGAATIGHRKRKHSRPGGRMEELPKRQKQPRERLGGRLSRTKRKQLKAERNSVLHGMRRLARDLANEAADRKADELEALKGGAAMYKAARELMDKGRARRPRIIQDGVELARDEDKAEAARKHFAGLFSVGAEGASAEAAGGKPLDDGLRAEEVRAAVQRLNNGKAAGPDGVAGELLKHGPDGLAQAVADAVNDGMASDGTGGLAAYLGRAVLVPLPKPGKAEGECKSLRPVMLTQMVRKVVPGVVLNRVREELAGFVSAAQSGFSRGGVDG